MPVEEKDEKKIEREPTSVRIDHELLKAVHAERVARSRLKNRVTLQDAVEEGLRLWLGVTCVQPPIIVGLDDLPAHVREAVGWLMEPSPDEFTEAVVALIRSNSRRIKSLKSAAAAKSH